jgi:hypothetical protein
MIIVTAQAYRQIWPKAPQGVIDAFAASSGQKSLDRVGITTTRPRLSVALSQVEHETAGFTIKDLTENIMYSAAGAAKTWPSRFPNGAIDVQRKYGTAAGWQLKLINDVYGGRMGNRPGTDDGSKYIGRGGPPARGGRDGQRQRHDDWRRRSHERRRSNFRPIPRRTVDGGRSEWVDCRHRRHDPYHATLRHRSLHSQQSRIGHASCHWHFHSYAPDGLHRDS